MDSSTPATPVRPANPALDVMMEPQRGFSLRQFWHAFLERIWIVALCLLAGLFIALGYLGRTPKTYQAHAVLEVDFQEPTVVVGDDSAARTRSMFLATQEALRTIEQNLTNRQMLARVIRAEGLADDNGAALLGSAPRKNAAAPAASPPQTRPAGTQSIVEMTFTPTEQALGGALASMVKPVIRRGTRLIDLYVTNRDPAMAQRLAEAVGREYIRNSIERRASFSQDTLRYLLEEEERLKVNLQKSEAAVAEYKEKNPDALQLGGGAANTGSQVGSGSGGSGGARGGIVEDKLQDLSSKMTQARSERYRLEGELKQIESAGDNIDHLLAVPSIASAVPVAEARRNVGEIEATIAALALRYKEKHPRMMAARAALREARDNLRRTATAQSAILRNAIAQAQATEQGLQNAFKEQQGTAMQLNRTAIGYQELARQAESDRALYESVLRQIKATDLTKDVKTNAVSIAEHAVLPRAPVNPIPSKTITFGLLGGLATGLAFVFGANALDRSIKTVDQAEAILGLPVLAAVPETKFGDSKSPVSEGPREAAKYRMVDEARGGPIAESFRNLRAALSLLGPEADRKVFLFTSALPNEGKSFTSVNYALALAQQGHRVLLIDGDLRRPNIHKIFQTKRDESPGIVDCLVNAASLEDAVRCVSSFEPVPAAGARFRTDYTKSGELYILAGGQRAPNPAELLSSGCFNQLVADAVTQFDRIVIDSAPVLAVSDTLLMVPYVQTTCIVLRAAKTPRNAVNRALTLLHAAAVRPAGLILNRLPRRRGAGYYYYYASHGYGDGGTYGDRYQAPASARVGGNGA
jgi:succinoglycan biosynthesis transport protein ExoP